MLCAQNATFSGRNWMRCILRTSSRDGRPPVFFGPRKSDAATCAGFEAAARSRMPLERCAESRGDAAQSEGALKLKGPGLQIVRSCDSEPQEMIPLQKQFGAADPKKIEDDVAGFLEHLHNRRAIDFQPWPARSH